MLTLHFRDGTAAHVPGTRQDLRTVNAVLVARLERALRQAGKVTDDVAAITVEGLLLPVRRAA